MASLIVKFVHNCNHTENYSWYNRINWPSQGTTAVRSTVGLFFTGIHRLLAINI